MQYLLTASRSIGNELRPVSAPNTQRHIVKNKPQQSLTQPTLDKPTPSKQDDGYAVNGRNYSKDSLSEDDFSDSVSDDYTSSDAVNVILFPIT